MLDAKIASALQKIITNPYFKKRGSLEEHKAQTEDRFLSGRQIAYIIPNTFRKLEHMNLFSDFTDLFSVTLHAEDFQDFDTRWDQA